jgi:uncharacterized membrane protein
LFLHWIRLVADVNTIKGRLPDFPGTASSAAVGSVPGASVSMLVVQRGAKKFFVATFTVDAGKATFFRMRTVSSLHCLFLLSAILQDLFKIV